MHNNDKIFEKPIRGVLLKNTNRAIVKTVTGKIFNIFYLVY